MILAEWTVGQAVWALFWGALLWSIFIAWILLVLRIFGDIMRNRDLSGFAKATWAIFVLVLPFLGIFLYLIVNGDGMADRAVGIQS